MIMVLIQSFRLLARHRKQRIAVTMLTVVVGAFLRASLFPDVTFGAYNIHNGLNGVKNNASGSFCDNEGSLHQLALDMINYSSPPGSKSYHKLKHVLDLCSFFWMDMGGKIFSSNQLMMTRMLHGMGLEEIKFKPSSLVHGVTLVETFFTRSTCPILKEECLNHPRILIQTEQKIKWPIFNECHKSPNCIILEFSDYNLNKALSNSTVLLPVMTQTPSRLSMSEPKTPTIIQHRSIDMVFFGLITNRRTFLEKKVQAYQEAHPNRQVHVGKNNRPSAVAASYAKAKVCLIQHSYRTTCGGEYHRLSEFAPFGCVPVVENFADTIGIPIYERCGGVIFTNLTQMMAAAEDVIAKIDQGLYNNRSKAVTNWWKSWVYTGKKYFPQCLVWKRYRYSKQLINKDGSTE